METIEVTVLYDDGSYSSYEWKFGHAEMLVTEIAAVSESSISGAHSKITLKSGEAFHCKEKLSDVRMILHSKGWGRVLSEEERREIGRQAFEREFLKILEKEAAKED